RSIDALEAERAAAELVVALGLRVVPIPLRLQAEEAGAAERGGRADEAADQEPRAPRSHARRGWWRRRDDDRLGRGLRLRLRLRDLHELDRHPMPSRPLRGDLEGHRLVAFARGGEGMG